jgi:beta-lactamase superfamily II metal-dependent hydrolase
METKILDADVVRVYEKGKPRKAENLIVTLMWGDTVRVTGKEDGQFVVELARRAWNVATSRYETVKRIGVLPAKTRFRDDPLLKVRFVDVGQGDAAMIETPKGQMILVDGGESEHLRRYINVAFSHILATKSLPCAAIVVTHGDADHYSGLTELLNAGRTHSDPLVTAARIFHNGLVKRSDTSPKTVFGKTATSVEGELYAVELEDDLLKVHDSQMNAPFKRWKAALAQLKKKKGGVAMRRLEYGDDDAFDFLEDEDIHVSVLGPITETVHGKSALPFLHTPGSKSLSASHTINGHSIVLKVTYGNVRFLFGADLNEEAEERLLERAHADGLSLSAEVLKVPHHGSADFSPRVLEAIRPVVSVASSGDENVAKEYIHPRAGLVGALGKYSRASVERPLVYVTEMVAFFERLGLIEARKLPTSKTSKEELRQIQNAYRKLAFGIVHVRTDGERVLVATHSGKGDRKESYAFRVDSRGEIRFEDTLVL